ncbi:MAG TPA: class I SAM-dependent methyltransferase [Gemmatimonadaceae bacterium]|nr:class I SAM-dependent methyltransferase [Gemmatimonadaceae bacterium]
MAQRCGPDRDVELTLHSSQQPTQTPVDLYDRYASTSSLVGVDVERTIAWTFGYFTEHFRRYLPRERDAAILDFGCGYGKNLVVLRQLGYSNCHGVDLSREQVAFARQRLGLTQVECADGLQWLQGKDDTFDVILVMDVLEHLPLAALLDLGSKMRAALKPGGMLIVQTPNGMSPLNPFAYGDLTHVRAFTAQSLRQFFLHAGLEPVEYLEALEHSHDVRSLAKRLMWKSVLRPAVHLFVRLAHGSMLGGAIYTANIIGIARKPVRT